MGLPTCLRRLTLRTVRLNFRKQKEQEPGIPRSVASWGASVYLSIQERAVYSQTLPKYSRDSLGTAIAKDWTRDE